MKNMRSLGWGMLVGSAMVFTLGIQNDRTGLVLLACLTGSVALMILAVTK